MPLQIFKKVNMKYGGTIPQKSEFAANQEILYVKYVRGYS